MHFLSVSILIHHYKTEILKGRNLYKNVLFWGIHWNLNDVNSIIEKFTQGIHKKESYKISHFPIRYYIY